MKTIKVSELYERFQGKPIYDKVYIKELGMAQSRLNDTGHELKEILETYDIENDANFNFNPFDYFGFGVNSDGSPIK